MSVGLFEQFLALNPFPDGVGGNTVVLGSEALASYVSGEAKASLPNLGMASYFDLNQQYWVISILSRHGGHPATSNNIRFHGAQAKVCTPQHNVCYLEGFVF